MVIEYLVGVFIIYLYIMFDKETVRIDYKAIRKFLIFMGCLSLFRMIIFYLTSNIIATEVVKTIPFTSLFWVFWEDAFFVLIPLALKKIIPKTGKMLYVNNIVFAIAMSGMSLLFMYGHSYQGNIGYLTVIYPFLIAYRYGIKVGFGTVMVCHVLYDIITYSTIKYWPNIFNFLSNIW